MIERKRPNKQYNCRQEKGPSSVRELEEAERSILKSIPQKHFSIEINDINKLTGNEDMFQDRRPVATRSSALKRSSCLHKLYPFLDDVGLLRVGGRLKNATTPYEVKYPIRHSPFDTSPPCCSETPRLWHNPQWNKASRLLGD